MQSLGSQIPIAPAEGNLELEEQLIDTMLTAHPLVSALSTTLYSFIAGGCSCDCG